jgi:hypothetical protein
MTPHVSDESIVDLAEGRGNEAERAHLAGCRGCAERVSEAAEILAAVRGAELPEPPAAYWSALARSVSRGIDDEPRRASGWRWLVPIAAAAAVVATVLPVRAPLAPASPPPVPVAPWSALPPLEEDAGALVLEAAGEPVAAALDEGRGLDSFVAGLTDDEAQALAEALRGPRQEGEL